MSDKYTEAAFDAAFTSINEHVGQLISEEDLVDILESLGVRGFKVVANTPPIQIPFVIRPTKAIDDLERYSVRREEVHGGKNYYAYYHQPDLGTAEHVKAEFDKELGRTDKTKIMVVNNGLSTSLDTALPELLQANTLPVNWIVNFPRFVDYVENPEELAARIRESVADLNVDWTYPKTVIVPESDVGSSESDTKEYVDLHISMDFSWKEPTEAEDIPHRSAPRTFTDNYPVSNTGALNYSLEELTELTEDLDPWSPTLTAVDKDRIIERCRVDPEYYNTRIRKGAITHSWILSRIEKLSSKTRGSNERE